MIDRVRKMTSDTQIKSKVRNLNNKSAINSNDMDSTINIFNPLSAK